MSSRYFKKAGAKKLSEETKYWQVLWLSLAVLLMEIVGGVWSGSLALLADAGHVLVDVVAIAASIIVARLVARGGVMSEARLRAWGGYFNASLLLLVALWVLYEAVGRYLIPAPILGAEMFAVALLGALGNFVHHRILEDGGDADRHITHQNLSAHIISDLLQSLSVIVAALIIMATGCTLIDPLLSGATALVMIFWSLKLFAGSRATSNGTYGSLHDHHGHIH